MADLASVEQELQRLRELIADLTGRVYRLEGAVKVETVRGSKGSEAPVPERVRIDVPAPSAPPPSSQTAGAEVFARIPRPATPQHEREVVSQQDNLESRIGSHWLNRVGIAAVLIGSSYFLKYAFDNNWIGPTGRVTIGLLVGIGIVVWSERFRTRGYPIFSYSLKAVGIGVLYLSLWAAFQVYRLIPGGAAFFAMIAVTGVTVVLAIAEDAEILAAIALIGGFVTPVLLSTGQNHEMALFSYVALLDFAALALVRFKPWGRLLVLNFAGTLILYAGWYSAYYHRDELRLTFAFATLFFSIFAIAPLFAQSGASAMFAKIPYAIALLNPAAYFLQIYAMLEEVDKNLSAWVALALAGVYVYLSREIGRRSRIAGMDLLHLALAVGFITIAIPIRLDAHWITVGWFVEAAVLLWVGDRIHSEFLNFFALAALVLAVVRLLLVDNFYSERLIFNSRIAVHAVAIIVLGLVAWFGSRRQDERGLLVAGWALVALNVLALVALTRDVADYYSHQMSAVQLGVVGRTRADWVHYHNLRIARDFTFSALWMAYGAMLMVIGFWRRSALARWQALALIAITIIKVFVYDVSQLDFGYRILSFIVLGVLLLAISFVYQRDWLKLSGAGSLIRGGLPPA